MAGKEHVVEHTGPKNGAWQTSEGINQSLDAFTRYLALTKCKFPNSVQKEILDKYPLSGNNTNALNVHDALETAICVGKNKKMPHVRDPYYVDTNGKNPHRRDGSYVDDNGTHIFKEIRYDDDPLFFLTNSIWMEEDSKIMLFACVYPLVKEKKQKKTSRGITWEYVPKEWNEHFKETGEKLEDKFTRDIGILREMDFIQKIKYQQIRRSDRKR